MRLPSFTGEASLYRSRHLYGGYSGSVAGNAYRGSVALQNGSDPCGCYSQYNGCIELCGLGGLICLFFPPACAGFATCLAGCQLKFALCSFGCQAGGPPPPPPECCPVGSKCSCGDGCVPLKTGGSVCHGQCLRPGQECN